MKKGTKKEKSLKFSKRFVGAAQEVTLIKNPWNANPPQKAK